ncbi:cobalamin-dependent protein [Peptoniphilus sp. KCTC 25270]|uniref:D-ornithine 4,5-aminomutase subunit OraE n=1 Tax=Peptoniphilus sp. KCTC 25270 TaxID=2897414 RepID=UPI001E32839D|nr:D-ornithine 4,5-aminomutase subunit OraE [Peptoniphilus sp. KCTC 25270]MCD1147062.1 cobalamin-dependent protein [Peptoniphilus sp. KCTC 25270]
MAERKWKHIKDDYYRLELTPEEDAKRMNGMKPLNPDEKINIPEIFEGLENYYPRSRGWHWRNGRGEERKIGDFTYYETSEPLKNSQPLPGSISSLKGIDPQPMPVITTEIASGRPEDDIRRMRMGAWHGADHLMVIRTAGQSHMDGLMEGTPQGTGGNAITRKHLRAQRKAIDLIEDEVGRPINYHSYVSGVAGPEVAVLFAEEGVNGAHQDPQYNVLYRNINMIRSFVDAGEAKTVMAYAGIAQIDGAHNANATAIQAWTVIPELMVQHGINSLYSVKVGMKKDNICLSTVPPVAQPAPSLRMNLPYAVALRDFFTDYKMRAQQNTKYMTASTREATVTHILDILTSELTSADIQSTITPDEGRNVPWHIFNIEACDNAKQAYNGLDGIMQFIKVRSDEEPLKSKIREIKEKSILYLEEIIAAGGYFNAVQEGFFVDSAEYPARNGDGIARDIEGGVGVNTVYERAEDYLAPVTAHYGYNNVAQYDESAVDNPSKLIGNCTLEDPEKIIYIDELDETDNVNVRLENQKKYVNSNIIIPEMEWRGDGVVQITTVLTTDPRTAEYAAIKMGQNLGLKDVECINVEVLQKAEGCRVEIKGKVPFDIDLDQLVIPPKPEIYSDDVLRDAIKEEPMTVVAGTVGQDEHSVGLREIIDIKHGGVEKYGIKVHYLGTSVPPEKLVDAAIEVKADGIMASTIISHDDIHYKNMAKIHEIAVEKGIRDDIIIVGGGTQVSNDLAVEAGVDAGFGRGTHGNDVATFLVKERNRRKGN